MSDKTFWVNKNVNRQISKCDLAVFDTGTTRSWVSTILMIGIVLIIMGLMQCLMRSAWGLYMAIAGAVAATVAFVLGRVYASKCYTEYLFEFDGKEMMFQMVGKNRTLFHCEDCTIEYVKGKDGGVKEVKTLYRPHLTSLAMLSVIYDQRVRKGESVIYLGKQTAVVDGKEKDVSYKIKLDKKNTMESYTADGLTLNAYFLREGQQKILVPIALFNAVRAKGIALPSDNLIVLDYGVKDNAIKDLDKRK